MFSKNVWLTLTLSYETLFLNVPNVFFFFFGYTNVKGMFRFIILQTLCGAVIFDLLNILKQVVTF